MNQRVFFSVSSHGYEFPKDGFGIRGVGLDVKPGGEADAQDQAPQTSPSVSIRVNRRGHLSRQRACRSEKRPLEQPVFERSGAGPGFGAARRFIAARSIGFWGDTNRAAYPLGHFGMAGAVSDLPEHGGLDPSVGVKPSLLFGR